MKHTTIANTIALIVYALFWLTPLVMLLPGIMLRLEHLGTVVLCLAAIAASMMIIRENLLAAVPNDPGQR